MNRPLHLMLSILLACSASAVAVAPPPTVESKDAVNPKCPISQRAIDGKTFVTYKGKRIGFCCPACDAKFLAWDDARKDAFIASIAPDTGTSPDDKKQETLGDPYTLATCPVTDEKLGSMGAAPIRMIDGREIRVCCKGCFKKIEEDRKKYFDKIDQQMAEDQRSHYPLETCVVMHDTLKKKGKDTAIEYVHNNRLFRLCCKDCIKRVKLNPGKYTMELDKAIRREQGKSYPLDVCPVSGEKLGAMGAPVERIVANRLIKLCCQGCMKKFDENPAKYIAMVDAARKSSAADHDSD
jgi:hypothetical protein